MRLFNHIVCLAAVTAFIFSSCSSADKPADGALPAADSTAALNPAKDSLGVATSDSPTEIFEGTYLGKALLFSHKDFQKFNYKEGDLVLSGAMNTEKGYGDDRSATVYVLNSDKPKNEQKFIVRGSNGSVYLLDQDRFVVDEANFAPAKVTVTPIPEIKPESRPVETKPVAAKKTETKKKIASKAKKKKTIAAKKAPAKKAVKANKKKKKKAVRKKARKKSRSKKTTSANSNKETPQN